MAFLPINVPANAPKIEPKEDITMSRQHQQNTTNSSSSTSTTLFSLPPLPTAIPSCFNSKYDLVAFSAIDACRTIACLSNNTQPDLFFRASQLIHTFLSLRPSIEESIIQDSVSEANRDDFLCLGAAALFAVGKACTNLNLMRLHKIVRTVGTVIRRRRIFYESLQKAQIEQERKMRTKILDQKNGKVYEKMKLEASVQSRKNEAGHALPQFVIDQMIAKLQSPEFVSIDCSPAAVHAMKQSSFDVVALSPEQKTTVRTVAGERARSICLGKEHLPELSAAEVNELNQRIVRWEWVLLEANAFVVISPTPYPLAMTLSSLVLEFLKTLSLSPGSGGSEVAQLLASSLPSHEDFTTSIVSYLNDSSRSALLCTGMAVEHVAIAAVYITLKEEYPKCCEKLREIGEGLVVASPSIPTGLHPKFWWSACCLPEFVPKNSSSSTSRSSKTTTTNSTKSGTAKKRDDEDDVDDSDDDHDDGAAGDESVVGKGGGAENIDAAISSLAQGSSSSSSAAATDANSSVWYQTKKHYNKVSQKIKTCVDEMKRLQSLEYCTYDLVAKFDELALKEKNNSHHSHNDNKHRDRRRDRD